MVVSSPPTTAPSSRSPACPRTFGDVKAVTTTLRPLAGFEQPDDGGGVERNVATALPCLADRLSRET